MIPCDMSHIHLFEFEDLTWFPDVIRKGMLDYLSFFLNITNFYKPSIPLIRECLDHSNSKQLLDLCSGGGGPVLEISKHLKKATGKSVPILLSDKFPNIDAFTRLATMNNEDIDYFVEPVDATKVPVDLKGVRTMFSAFHHFRPEKARSILRDAAEKQAPIAIFDGGDKNILAMLGIIIIHPILFIFCTPFFKPFRASRILLTYLIPLIPLCTVWDGIVSILRLYTPKSIHQLTEDIQVTDYNWQTGTKKNTLGLTMSFLIGYPDGNVNHIVGSVPRNQ